MKVGEWMFTGIIEEIGQILGIRRSNQLITLEIQANKVLEEVKLGDSIATNGVCLTITELGDRYFKADVMAETMQRTNLSAVKRGDKVNLERALRLTDRLNGHYVTGHVDFMSRVTKKYQQGEAWIVEVSLKQDYGKYVLSQGSITIDGISLTVVRVVGNKVGVSIIPHTGGETTLLGKKVGDPVNIECDHFAKYIEQLLEHKERSRVAYESY